jgi:hypothetical protein
MTLDAIEIALNISLKHANTLYDNIINNNPEDVTNAEIKTLKANIINIQDAIANVIEEKGSSDFDLINKNTLDKFNEYNKSLMSSFKQLYVGEDINIDPIITKLSTFGKISDINIDTASAIINSTNISDSEKASLLNSFKKAIKECK